MSDLRLAFRLLAKSRGFTAVAVLLLALGIGANTAFFSVFKAQVLAPFPYPDAGRVVQLWRTNGTALNWNPWSAPDFFDVQDESTSFTEMGAFRPDSFTLGGDSPTPVTGIACTPGVLRALGMQPALGRWFTDDDEKTGAPPAVILSHACWLQQFGGDPTLVGRSIRLSGQETALVGVMPAEFEFYCPWTGRTPISLWVPLRLAREGQFRGSHGLLAVGRLKPGVSVNTAKAELKVLSQRLEAAHPDTNFQKWFYPFPLTAELMRKELMGYGLVAAAVTLVLIVASANLAIMFLARGSGRQIEYAVRLALGASRGDLVRLALTESLVLAVVGGAAGVFVAWNATGLLARVFVPLSTHGGALAIDQGVLGYSLLLALVSSLASGLPPALTAARTDVIATMKEGGNSQAGSRTRHRFLRHLVGAQVAVALILANTALLLLVNHRATLAFSEPLSSESVLSSEITLKGSAYRSGPARLAFWERWLDRVRTLPGVTSAAVTTKLPLHGGNNTTILANGQAFDPKISRPLVEMSWVSPDYFAAMGIGRHAGRTHVPTDTNAKTPGVVVNRKLASTCWPQRDPLGQTFRNDGPNPDYTATVVGVVDDVRQWDIGYPAQCEMYLPFAMNARGSAYLVVRSARDARQLTPLLRRELAALDPDLALAEPTTMAELVNDAAGGRRTLLGLTNFFMVATLVMAAVGIYGTLSFQTRQRTREIGVRLALGAAARDIVGLVLRQTVPWIVSGAAVGIVASVGVAYGLRPFFADVNLINPLYYLGGLIALGAVLVVACWLPARRATRVNPVEALRAE